MALVLSLHPSHSTILIALTPVKHSEMPKRKSFAPLLPRAAVLAKDGQHTSTSLLAPFPGQHTWETVHALEGAQAGYEQLWDTTQVSGFSHALSPSVNLNKGFLQP